MVNFTYISLAGSSDFIQAIKAVNYGPPFYPKLAKTRAKGSTKALS